MSETREEISLTIDDIDTAIRILKIFLRRYEEAQRLLRKLGSYQRSGRIEDILLQSILQPQKTVSQPLESEDEYVDADEIKRLREVAKRIKEIDNK